MALYCENFLDPSPDLPTCIREQVEEDRPVQHPLPLHPLQQLNSNVGNVLGAVEDEPGFFKFTFYLQSMLYNFENLFLPAAKPPGHRTVRVVVVVGGGDNFNVMTLKAKVTFFFFASILFSHPKFPLGWDPSRFIRICQSLCSPTLNFLGVGSRALLPDFSLGWDL